MRLSVKRRFSLFAGGESAFVVGALGQAIRRNRGRPRFFQPPFCADAAIMAKHFAVGLGKGFVGQPGRRGMLEGSKGREPVRSERIRSVMAAGLVIERVEQSFSPTTPSTPCASVTPSAPRIASGA